MSIEITKITVRKTVVVQDEAAKMNLKKLIADILKVNIVDIQMNFTEK